jgi:2'-5' RNA ligase
MNSGEQQQRLFFALWPDEPLQQRLAQLQHLDGLAGKGRAVATHKLHVTLAFLGNVDFSRRACVIEAADRVTCAPFNLSIDRLGHWRRPQVLWAGCSSVPPACSALAGELGKQLIECGFQPEHREFIPHITLLRKVRKVSRLPAIEPLDWRVADFRLVLSRPVPGGVEYEIQHSWALNG